MLQKLQIRYRAQGFTIVEVLFVLAIAGLILLIVFLEVPQVERNSRNSDRKNDVAAVLGAVTDFLSNNEGEVPDDLNPTGTPNTYSINIGNPPSGSEVRFKLNFYKAIQPIQTGNQGIPTTPPDYLQIVTGATCNSDGTTMMSAGRQIVVQYELETGAGLTVHACQST